MFCLWSWRVLTWIFSTVDDISELQVYLGFPGGLDGKESACSARDLGLIPGLGRFPGGGNGNPLQYSCLENPMDRSLAGYTPWGRKSLTTEQLSMHACTFKNRVYSPPASLCTSPSGLQSQISWGFIYLVQDFQGWGAQNGSQTPCFMGRSSAIIIVLLSVGQIHGNF